MRNRVEGYLREGRASSERCVDGLYSLLCGGYEVCYERLFYFRELLLLPSGDRYPYPHSA